MSARFCAGGDAWVRGREIGGGRRCWGGFRAHARCRSETGAPLASAPLSRDPALSGTRREGTIPTVGACAAAALTLAGGGVVGAGFALPRDAGRRPALQAVPALLRGSAVRGFAALSGCDAGPHRENRPEVGSTRSPRPYESAVPRWCTSRCPSHYAERRAGKGTPTSGRHSPPQAGGGKDPEFGGGSPLGRDPGVQRHPGGWVVHALRCASRSGADRRSAFPCLRRHPDCWGSRRTCIFTATGRRSALQLRLGASVSVRGCRSAGVGQRASVSATASSRNRTAFAPHPSRPAPTGR